jgi:hypothetical protein
MYRRKAIRFLGIATSATTGFITDDFSDTKDFFPNDDFFPDVDNLFGEMSLSDGSASALAPYVTIYCLFQFMIQALLFSFQLDSLLPENMFVLPCYTYCSSTIY